MPPEQVTQLIPIEKIIEPPDNPRRHFDPAQMAELVTSVRTHGVMQPILVRPIGKEFELVAGARRLRAAKEAEQPAIPAVVRELDDKTAAELRIIENLHRVDLHPMEEAQGFRDLVDKHGMTIDDLMKKTGKSRPFIYARLQLVKLIKPARALFLEGKIGQHHAAIISRQPKEAQDRILNEEGVLFEPEEVLQTPDERQANGRPMRTRTPGELQAWVDQHVRFDTAKVDPELFPETAANVREATQPPEEEGKKPYGFVPITHNFHVDPGAKDGSRTFGPMSWRRADGSSKKDPKCEHATLGVIVVGPGRGESFQVCVDKKKCEVHWKQPKKTKATASAEKARDAATKEQEKWKRENERREALRAQWQKAQPAIVKAAAERIAKMPTKGSGLLAQIILRDLSHDGKLPKVKTEAEVIRAGALIVAGNLARRDWERDRVVKWFRGLGVNVPAILEEEAPIEKPAPAPKGPRGRPRKPKAKKARKGAA